MIPDQLCNGFSLPEGKTKPLRFPISQTAKYFFSQQGVPGRNPDTILLLSTDRFPDIMERSRQK
jgi:hypothetical protein